MDNKKSNKMKKIEIDKMGRCRETHVKQQQIPVYSQLNMYLPARRDVYIYIYIYIYIYTRVNEERKKVIEMSHYF